MRPNWDQFYMNLADVISTRSKDDSTKVGAILVKDNAVISMGYNGMPRNVNDDVPVRHERPTKYFYFEHAERNAIYNAARHGISTLNSTMYTQGVPCADCARAVIQAGITKVVAYHQATWNLPMWGESCARGREMLVEAMVEIKILGDPT